MTLNDFEATIKQLAEALWEKVEEDLSQRGWKTAVLDVRFNKKGTSWNTKIRATSASGVLESIKDGKKIFLLVNSLKKMRKGITPDEWFGLLLSVNHDRTCTVNLNYDSTCSEDKSFFES